MIDFGAAPLEPGIYAIFNGRRLLYIGSSMKLRQRLRTHSCDFKRKGSRATFFVYAGPNLEGVENWLIVEYRPLLNNVRYTPFREPPPEAIVSLRLKERHKRKRFWPPRDLGRLYWEWRNVVPEEVAK